MFQATLMGISSSIPLKNRDQTSLAIKYGGEVILFDAGEGLQQRMMKAKISYMEVSKIFITHFHADHFLGLPGLLATMSLHKRETPVTIFGPKGVEQKINNMLNVFEISTVYKINYVELKNGVVFEDKDYMVEARLVRHSLETYALVFREKDRVGKFIKEKALALGIPEGPLYSELKNGNTIRYGGKEIKPEQVVDYSVVKKGKSIGYVVDCFDSRYVDFISNVDILFHEAMFMKKDLSNAKKTLHSVTTKVGEIAKNAKVKRLIIMNFSARYTDLNAVLYEVQKMYPDAELGEELKTYKL